MTCRAHVGECWDGSNTKELFCKRLESCRRWMDWWVLTVFSIENSFSVSFLQSTVAFFGGGNGFYPVQNSPIQSSWRDNACYISLDSWSDSRVARVIRSWKTNRRRSKPTRTGGQHADKTRREEDAYLDVFANVQGLNGWKMTSALRQRMAKENKRSQAHVRTQTLTGNTQKKKLKKKSKINQKWYELEEHLCLGAVNWLKHASFCMSSMALDFGLTRMEAV